MCIQLKEIYSRVIIYIGGYNDSDSYQLEHNYLRLKRKRKRERKEEKREKKNDMLVRT